ncbi:MAG: hypothetical protein JJU13_00095 [Balneolaceae bacterium]|nr:hypothetical protein [Balneolaceae bacterium]
MKINMLDEWIRELRLKNDYSVGEKWKYQVSGNAIEFSVPRASIFEKEVFRNAVITIGRVLKALSRKIEESNCQFHIQSFPNLENPEIIASIRMDPKNKHRQTFPDIQSAENVDDIISKLKSISKEYQFELIHLAEKENLTDQYQELIEGRECYALVSKFDNPFSWLNLGYLKEAIAIDCCVNLSDKPEIVIDSFLENNQRAFENDYIQALVFFDPVKSLS